MTLDSAWKHREAADPLWAERAACIGMTDIMFGFVTTRRLGVNWSRARKVCASCPVRDACLEHALANDETDGMWGGKSPGERVDLAVRRTHDGRHGTLRAVRAGCDCDLCADCRTYLEMSA